MNSVVVNPPSAAQWLFDRLDAAREKVGQEPVLDMVPYRIRCEIAAAMEEEVREELERRNKTNAQPKKGAQWSSRPPGAESMAQLFR